VENQSGQFAVAAAQRLRDIKQEVQSRASLELGLAVGAAGIAPLVGRQVARKYSLKEDRPQYVILAPGTRCEFQLGGGAEGAYVTAAVQGSLARLFCKDRVVECGFRLVLGTDTFSSSELAAMASGPS
jgi:hypothetical protein